MVRVRYCRERSGTLTVSKPGIIDRVPRRKSSPASRTTDPIGLDRLRKLLEAPKRLATVPRWQERNEKLLLSCPLMIEGAVVEGLELRGTALLRRPLCEVMLGLVYAPAGLSGGMFERIDAWPLRPHRNPGHGPAPLRLLTIDAGRCHRHGLEDNAHLPVVELFDRLPVAEPLEPQPESWDALSGAVAEFWRITCDTGVPPPPWAPDLFSIT